MDDVRGLYLGMPHGTTPAAVTTNKNIIVCSFKSSGDIQKKEGGQTAVSDNQSSSVTLNINLRFKIIFLLIRMNDVLTESCIKIPLCGLKHQQKHNKINQRYLGF